MELTRWLPTCMMRPVFFCGFDERLAVVDMLHHRLFAVDVLAGVHGVDGDILVPVVGRGDDDGVDIRAAPAPRDNRAW